MSVAQQALKELKIPVEKYYASEIDKYAVAVAQSNFPNTIQLGDVVGLKLDEDIDLLIGGSPCQDLSIAKKNREGLKGARSGLFYEYVRIRDEVKPKYFILENVASMPKEAKEQISEILGVEPIMINASLVSAQNRKRLFWIGKWNGEKYKQVEIEQPEDKGILLKDILEEEVDEKYFVDREKAHCIDANYHKGANWESYKKKGRRQLVRVGSLNSGGQGDRIYSKEGKSTSLSANGGGRGAKTGLYAVSQRGRNIVDGKRKDIKGAKTEQRIEVGQSEKAHCITKVQKDSMVAIKSNYNNTLNYNKSNTLGSNSQCQTAKTGQSLIDLRNYTIRKLTPTECLRLQSMPDNYFDKATITRGNSKKEFPISNTQRYKMCGNAFNCSVVKHIINQIK
jgi:DNA (cytosine-5)-methyltransferase 3A